MEEHNPSSYSELDSPLLFDWCEVFEKIKNKNAHSKIENTLTALYGLSLEFIKIQKEQEEMRVQLTNKNCCRESRKIIHSKNSTLEALASLIIKLEESQNVNNFLAEAYKVISSESILLTPPSKAEKAQNSSKTPISKEYKCLKQLKTPEPLTINAMRKDVTVTYLRNKENVNVNEENFSKFRENEDKSSEDSIEKVLQEKVLRMNKSSDISVPDDSLIEIYNTPSGRVSPIIGISKCKRNARESKSSEEKSPRSKVKISRTRRAGRGGLRQTTLQCVKSTRPVKLTEVMQFGGLRDSHSFTGSRKSHVASLEDDDIIQPSPTSESISNTFCSKLQLDSLQRVRSPLKPTCPPQPRARPSPPSPHPSPPAPFPSSPPSPLAAARCVSSRPDSPETHVLTGIDFDEPMETDSLDSSMNLLERHQDTRLSPPASESRAPHSDTNVSVSVLKRPFRAKLQREHVECELMDVHKRKNKSMKCSPVKKSSTEARDKQNVEESISLLDNYQDRRGPKPCKVTQSKTKEEQEPFPYKEEPVRKKSEKLLLPGWSCEECKHYYSDERDPERLSRLMRRCSKHRGRQNPTRRATPPGFWDNHLSVPDDTEALNRLNNVQ